MIRRRGLLGRFGGKEMQYQLLKTITAPSENYVLSEDLPACTSLMVKVVMQPAQAIGTLRVMSAHSNVNYSSSRFHDLYLTSAIGTGTVTTLIYLFAGSVVPFAVTKIGSGAMTLQQGRINGITLPSETTIRQLHMSGGIPEGSTIEIYGCTEE